MNAVTIFGTVDIIDDANVSVFAKKQFDGDCERFLVATGSIDRRALKMLRVHCQVFVTGRITGAKGGFVGVNANYVRVLK